MMRHSGGRDLRSGTPALLRPAPAHSPAKVLSTMMTAASVPRERATPPVRPTRVDSTVTPFGIGPRFPPQPVSVAARESMSCATIVRSGIRSQSGCCLGPRGLAARSWCRWRDGAHPEAPASREGFPPDNLACYLGLQVMLAIDRGVVVRIRPPVTNNLLYPLLRLRGALFIDALDVSADSERRQPPRHDRVMTGLSVTRLRAQPHRPR